jgi:hypothetical protein
MKRSPVRSAGTLIERDFGLMELHASSPDLIEAAQSAILEALDLEVADRLTPTLVSSQRLSRIEALHSQLFNKVRRGAWTLPGDTLSVIEVTPAAYVYLLANEVEKATACELVRVAGTGLYGRMIVAGDEAQAAEAERAIRDTIAAVRSAATDDRSGGG